MKTGQFINFFKVPLSIIFLLLTSVSFAQLQFVENKGQWEKEVDYKSDIANGAFFLQRQGFTVLVQNEKELAAISERLHGHIAGEKNNNKAVNVSSPLVLHQHAYRVSFSGALAGVKAEPDKALPTYNNYFIGNDQSKWQGNCKIYQGVTYRNMYPNIDVRYYTDQGTLKYDIIVHPGGNIDNIVMRYEGVDELSVKNKELIIGTSVGDVKELYPYSYQTGTTGRQTVDCKYVVDQKSKTVRFKVKDYDPATTIIIDPTLIFCSFTGSTKDNWGFTATPGPDGSLYAGGIVFGAGFPVSIGAFQVTFGDGVPDDAIGLPYDIGIIRFSPNGNLRLYATYLGGSGNEQPHSMICDENGNLVVAGRTNSPTVTRDRDLAFPVTRVPVGPNGGYDIFVTKLNATGNALLGSLRMGGTQDDGVNIKGKYVNLNVPGQNEGAYDTRRNYGDDARSEVILDENNNIYLASCTQSINDFPVSANAAQPLFGGGGAFIKQDGIVAKFSSNLSAVIFSTHFGGSGNDACFVLSINPLTSNIYVAGGTTSADLPAVSSDVLNPAYQGGVTDGFVTVLSADGSAFLRTTYIGTNDGSAVNDGNDLVYGIQFDKYGFPYIMGATTGNWQAKNATFNNPGGKQFIAKLQPDLSSYVYTTMFGTNSSAPNISPVAFLVDKCQNVYVSGWGGALNNSKQYPNAGTGGMEFLVTPGAVQSSTDKNDFFFFVMEKDAQSQLYGTFFGQLGGFTDHVDGGTSRFDNNGVIYQAICANCNNVPGVFFPTTPGVWSANNPSRACNEAVVKIEMNFTGVGANIRTIIGGIPNAISGCNPLRVSVFDSLSKAQRFFWNWGDGTKVDTLFTRSDTSHLYNLPAGVDSKLYTIMLIAEDSNTCNIRDTAYKTIRVSTNFATLGFNAIKQQPCTNLSYQFINTSRAFLGSFDNKGFIWDFGDGSVDTGSISYNPIHRYASTGTYIVRLCVIDTFVCNSPDCYVDTVRISDVARAIFETSPTGCAPYTPVFKNNSLGGLSWLWNFGDNTSSTEFEPAGKIYNLPGTYTIRLTVFDSTTCNKQHDTTFAITVYPIPTALGEATPNPGETNKPINFINRSVGASSYKWEFGDGETSTLENPSHLFNETKEYTVLLIAFNDAGCSDTFPIIVQARVLPLLDVPTAFTPGKFGVNSQVSVVGFGIGKMDWRIYNRWGQLVFQTANRKDGWDGTYKGKAQPMDVYTYTLDVEFTDGKKLRKTGDITLLR